MARLVLSEGAGVVMALESTPGTAPSSGYQTIQPMAGGIELDPELETVERDYLNPYAADEQGDVVGIKANAKIKQHLTMDLLWLIRQQLLRSNSKDAGGAGAAFIRLTAATDGGGSADGFTHAAVAEALPSGTLVFVAGFTNAANNGLFMLTSGSTTTSSKVPTATLVAETADAVMLVVGFQFSTADAEINSSNHLITTTKDLTEFDLVKGAAVIIGDEAAGTRFGSLPLTRKLIAYVKSTPTANLIELEDHNYTPAGADNGSGKTIRLFFGSFLRNYAIGDNTNYVQKTAHLELSDQNAATGNTVPAFTYGEGMALGMLTLTAPLKQPIEAEMSFVGMDIPAPVLTASRVAGGGSGAGQSPATAHAPLFTEMLETANDLEEFAVYDSSGTLIAEINSWKLTLNHNVTPLEIQGEAGAVGHIFGRHGHFFDLEVYFADEDQIAAGRENRSLKARVFVANGQGGFAIRQMRTALRQPKKSYAANQPVMLATQMPSFKDADNIVMGITIFGYVPFGGE